MVTLVGGGRYRLGAEEARCRTGAVHRGVDKATGTEVAIKLEPPGPRSPRLPHEAKMYWALVGVTGVPRIYWSGSETGVNVMVVERMGCSLGRLFGACGRKFDGRTVAMVALQLLSILEHLHARDYVHRDVRPETLLRGRGPSADQVHLVGFALAKRYRHRKTKQHIPYGEGNGYLWNPVFASINVHLGREPSRRDDLESAGYVIAYLFRGDLPWQAVAPSRGDGHAKILEAKQRVPVEELCEGCPPQLARYISCCRQLAFEERPDYAHLRSLLREASWHLHSGRPSDLELPTYDFAHDWTLRHVPCGGDPPGASCCEDGPLERPTPAAPSGAADPGPPPAPRSD